MIRTRVVIASSYLAFVGFGVPLRSTAQLPTAMPTASGFSAQRLARIDSVIRRDIVNGRMPGAVIAIARHGKLVYFEAHGFLDRRAETAMPKDAIFALASMTKPIVAAAAMRLYEENKLLINDPIGKYLPVLANIRVASSGTSNESPTVPVVRPPTIQDLMRHTAGMTNGNSTGTTLFQRYAAALGGARSGKDYLDSLASLPLHYQPGTEWGYGQGFDVLGLAMESITGQPLGTVLADYVFNPLGMVDTDFSIPLTKMDRWAKPLPMDPLTGQPQAAPDPTKPPRFQCGGGCLYGTAADYIRFAQMLLDKGRSGSVRVIGRKTIEYMTADHIGPEVNTARLRAYPNINGYGFGMGVAVRRGYGVAGIMGSPGAYHWGGASGAFFWVDPEEQLAVVFLAATPGDLRNHYRQVITSLVLQAIDD